MASGETRVESVDFTFVFGSEQYRLRRTRALWNADYHEDPVLPDEARRIIEAVTQQRADDVAFVRSLNGAASHLSGLHQTASWS